MAIVTLQLDNNKEVIQLIKEDNYDIITLQEIMRKIDDNLFEPFEH